MLNFRQSPQRRDFRGVVMDKNRYICISRKGECNNNKN